MEIEPDYKSQLGFYIYIRKYGIHTLTLSCRWASWSHLDRDSAGDIRICLYHHKMHLAPLLSSPYQSRYFFPLSLVYKLESGNQINIESAILRKGQRVKNRKGLIYYNRGVSPSRKRENHLSAPVFVFRMILNLGTWFPKRVSLRIKEAWLSSLGVRPLVRALFVLWLWSFIIRWEHGKSLLTSPKSKSFRSKIGKRNARDLEIYPLPSFCLQEKTQLK